MLQVTAVLFFNIASEHHRSTYSYESLFFIGMLAVLTIVYHTRLLYLNRSASTHACHSTRRAPPSRLISHGAGAAARLFYAVNAYRSMSFLRQTLVFATLLSPAHAGLFDQATALLFGSLADNGSYCIKLPPTV
jgi:hypothetical protein